MTAQEFIENRLEGLKTGAETAPDFKSAKDLADFVFKAVMNKKFRKFSVTPVSLHYTTEEFEEDLKDKIEIMKKELGGLPVLNERAKRMVELNVKLKPEQDNDFLWKEKIELLHQAYYTVSRRRLYNRAKDKISVFCTKLINYLCLGTTKTSVAKFWAGAGALKKTADGGFMEYVLAPSQLESGNFINESILIKGLESRNFKNIRIMEMKN